MKEITIRVFTISEAARLKSATRPTIYNAVKRGQLTRLDVDGEFGIIDDAKFAAFAPAPTHWDAKKAAKSQLATAA